MLNIIIDDYFLPFACSPSHLLKIHVEFLFKREGRFEYEKLNIKKIFTKLYIDKIFISNKNYQRST